MKKGILLVCLLLIMTACQTKEDKKIEDATPSEVQAPEENVAIKLDASKDYVYATNRIEANISDEQAMYFEKRDKAIQTLVVNINSDDAKKVSEELKQEAQTLKERMVNGEDGTLQQFTSLSGEAMVSDAYVSILLKEHPFIWQSEEIQPTYRVYVFSKKDGRLISQNELLKNLDLTKDEVIDKLKQIYKENEYPMCGNEMAECYFEPQIYQNDNDFPDTSMYVNDNNDLIVYVRKSLGRSICWEPIVIGL